MTEQLRRAPERDEAAQGSTGNISHLNERLHRLAAYWALAVIAIIVFGSGTPRF